MILFKPITRRNGEIHVVKVDYKDAWLFLKYKYYIKRGRGAKGNNTGEPYVARGLNYKKPNGKMSCKTIFLHHDIVDYEPDGTSALVVDHINRQTLNNTRKNLRLVTQKVNLENQKQNPLKKGYVFARKRGNLSYYQVIIKRKYVACCKSYTEAIYKRDEYLKKLGEKGRDALAEIYKDK